VHPSLITRVYITSERVVRRGLRVYGLWLLLTDLRLKYLFSQMKGADRRLWSCNGDNVGNVDIVSTALIRKIRTDKGQHHILDGQVIINGLVGRHAEALLPSYRDLTNQPTF
jgi:hypothetical protein